MKVSGEAYTLDIPTSLRLHPTFYVGRLKKYHAATIPSATNLPAPERRANTTHDAQSASPQAPSESAQPGSSPHQPPSERPMHDSQRSPSRLGSPKRTSYRPRRLLTRLTMDRGSHRGARGPFSYHASYP
ncbi:hypothetical protein PF001_g4916 [Phytophthora fragariae]|uniref:Pol Polyprotein n=1 Tax=Phytophthora fragariae TaxID=53985 RepID=A0A6A4EEU9_9STRA|nr:hypothetical protein PF003_g10277 [Phytophthora fragariae]KAE9321437.1 hypothetical protein PF001_g4916 [Phytophthora fragariae]